MHGPDDYAHLRGWTPISFSLAREPAIQWADMRSLRFDAPFFRSTQAQWRRESSGATVTTGLAALRALDSSPSLDPCLIIAHGSRCGSTWLAGLMRAMDGALTVSEPGCLLAPLSLDFCGHAAFASDEILRQLVRAYGRIRFGDERRYVLKLSSTLTRFLPQFRRAFPGVPMIWLQRRPSEIVESNLYRPGEWIHVAAGGGNDVAKLVLQKMAMLFLAANSLVDDDMLVLDYCDLPDAAWTQVAPFIGVSLTERERERMRDIASLDSKSAEPFVRRKAQALPAPVQATIRRVIDPLYEALGRRRAAA